jgi:mono/diheme cytochrome c family protein
MNSILWLGTLGALYIFYMFMTPVKPPAPRILEVKKSYSHFETPVLKTTATPEAEVVVETLPIDLERGKTIYLSTCIKCHNKDPNIKGAIGPEIVDAPLEIMQHKVATGRYPDILPEGFIPKRKTKQMTKFPNLLRDVPSIHAYVQSLKKQK